MTDPLNRLLDQAATPSPSSGFADRITARATAQSQQGGLAVTWRRDRRGGWMRRPRALATFIGANLLVASAVAATYFSGMELPPLREVPVFAPVIEAIVPQPRPRPLRIATALEAPGPAAAPAAAAEVSPRPAPPRVERLLARRDALADRVRAREAAGLPVPPRVKRRVALHGLEKQAIDQWRRGEEVPMDLKRQIVRERLELAPPRLRERVIRRVEERRAAGLPVAPALDAEVPSIAPVIAPDISGAAVGETPRPSAERLRRWQAMTPGERQHMLQRLRARRAARMQGQRP